MNFAQIMHGRYTAKTDEPFVVFVIGLRIINLFAIHHWIPIIVQMQKMIIELYKNKELGYEVFY